MANSSIYCLLAPILSPLSLMAGAHDELACILAAAGFETQGLLAPRSARGFGHAVAAAVAAAMGVICCIHNYAADGGALALVAAAAGFADLDVLVLFIANYAQTGGAIFID